MIRSSIGRPVAVTMAYASVALLGAFAWKNIPIELLPDTSLPQLSVSARWEGTSPEAVEAFLTSPLEAVVQQVQGVSKVVSTSREGTTQVTVDFARGTDMDFARLDLSERLAALQVELPAGVSDVAVSQYVPEEFQEQNQPFLSYRLTGPYTPEALRQHLDDVVRPQLEQVDGAGLVTVLGGRDRVLEVRLDADKVAALGLDPSSIGARLRDLDLVRDAGVVRQGDRQQTVTIVNRAATAEDVQGAVLSSAAGTLVRVGDVATVHDAFEEARGFSRVDGSAAVRFEVRKEHGANTVRVADAVKARLAQVQRRSPYGTRFILDRDEGEQIRERFHDLRIRAAVSALVIFAVLLVFLRSFRSAALILSTIGLSALIALNLIYFSGMALNLLTLMGLAMGFGLIVDNCIVVLENVHRRWQGGEAAEAAAESGTKEVVLAILASTATNLIVFIPFLYLQGEVRVYYVPLAVAVSLTNLASLVVGFTFIPAVAARLLRAGRVRARPMASSQSGRPLYVRFYGDLVAFTLRHPWLAMSVTGAMFGGSWYLFDRYVTTWHVWSEGGTGDSYIDVRIALPRGSDLALTDQLVQYFEEKLARTPAVERFTSEVQPTNANLQVTFPDSIDNTAVPLSIYEQMIAFSHTFTGADVRVYGYGPSFYGGGGGAPNYTIAVLGYNYERVRDIAEDLGSRFASLARVREVDTNASGRFTRDRASEFVLHVDRARLAGHDLTVEGLVAQVNAAVGGRGGGGTLKLGGEEVAYEVKLREVLDMDVLALAETLIATPSGERIRLGDVVRVEPRDVLAVVTREDQQYRRAVAYEFRGPVELGDLLQGQVIASMDVPPGYTIEAERFLFASREDRAQIWMVLAVALVLVYMVTAAAFESLLQPLCVMLTVPMALMGVYLSFFYTQAAFTREAYVGVIMMFGIVVNNAILLVDHVNRVRRQRPGLSLHEAILQGTQERVRPILMTTATTVLGLLPLVLFGESAGGNIWDALALVLIGGLFSSTFFVLTITPAVYGVLERWRLRGRGGVERALRPVETLPAVGTLPVVEGV